MEGTEGNGGSLGLRTFLLRLKCQSQQILLCIWKHSQVRHTRSKIKLNYHPSTMLCWRKVCESAWGVPLKPLIITCKGAQPRAANDVIAHMWSRMLYPWSDILTLDIYFLKHQKQWNAFPDLLWDAPFSAFKTCPCHPSGDPAAISLDTPPGKLWEMLYLEAHQPVSHATFCLCFSSSALLLP